MARHIAVLLLPVAFAAVARVCIGRSGLFHSMLRATVTLFGVLVKPYCVAGCAAVGGVAGLPASHVARIPFFRAVERSKPLGVGKVAEKL